MIESIGNSSATQEMSSTKRASLFDKFDSDSDGSLSSSEVEGLLDDISEKTGESMSLEDFMAELDRDGNGEINAEEAESMKDMMGPPPGGSGGPPPGGAGGPPPGGGEEMFANVDTDSSGDVSESELAEMLSDISEASGQSLDSSEVLGELDSDGDGVLSEEEMSGLKDVIGPPPEPPGGMGAQGGVTQGTAVDTYTQTAFAAEEDLATTLLEI